MERIEYFCIQREAKRNTLLVFILAIYSTDIKKSSHSNTCSKALMIFWKYDKCNYERKIYTFKIPSSREYISNHDQKYYNVLQLF